MAKRWMLLLIAVGLLLPSVVGAATPTQYDNYTPLGTVDVWLDPFDIYTVYWLSLDTGDTIYVDIEVTSGGDIDFFICDYENYNLYTSLETATVYRNMENRGSISLSFNVPNSGRWHVVFQNDALLTRKHIEGSVGLTPPAAITSALLIAVAATGIIIVGFIGVVVVIKRKAGDKQPTHQPYTTQAPVVLSTEVTFCSYCGTHRQSFDARFCAKCGNPFRGPEFE